MPEGEDERGMSSGLEHGWSASANRRRWGERGSIVVRGSGRIKERGRRVWEMESIEN